MVNTRTVAHAKKVKEEEDEKTTHNSPVPAPQKNVTDLMVSSEVLKQYGANCKQQ
jgi:hypothetical protein